MGAYIINVPSTVDRIIYVNVHPMDGKTYLASYSVDELTPYTEPDLEQIKADWYKAGREAERVRQPDIEQVRKEGYKEGREVGIKDGMCEAWEASKKIINMPFEERRKIFVESLIQKIHSIYTASEAIEKIRQYEQEQDGLRQNIQTIVDKCGYSLDEIAAVLEKMRGEQDG